MANIETVKTLDRLIASGYACGELGDDVAGSTVRRDDEFEQRVQFLKILTMCAMAPR